MPANRGQSEPETTERFVEMVKDGPDLAMTGWQIEVRDLANTGEGLGAGLAGPVDKSEKDLGAGPAQALLIK